jgi:cell division protein FtsL
LASARGGALATPARNPTPRRAPVRATPKPSPRGTARRAARRRLRPGGAIAWIVVGALLLTGVVFVNLAVLRLNLRLNQATQSRAQLDAQYAALESQLSSVEASGRIQQLASSAGLQQATSIGYINLGR